MRVLVIGVNGLLGSNVVAAGQDRGWKVYGTYYSTASGFDIPTKQFNLADASAFNEILDRYEPDVVINCAAMTDVDACERNPEQAEQINGDSPGILASQCDAYGSEFVHTSTDYVFNGKSRDRYTEADTPNPIQVYGHSKLAGEQTVQEARPDSLIARLSFVYGIHRGSDTLAGFPAWVRNRIESGEDVPLFTDQWITPSRAGQAADTILDLIEHEATGRSHIAARTCVTPYEFGKQLAAEMETGDASFVEASLDDIDREASRPAYTCLNTDKIATELGRKQPPLAEDVAAISDAL